MLHDAGASLDSKELGTFTDLVRRSLIELQHRKLDRYHDTHGSPFHDHLFDPARSATVTFADLTKIFLGERMAAYEANDVATKRQDKIKAIAAYFLKVIGEATPVGSIDDNTVQHVRTTLTRTPTNVHKKYPGLSLD